MRVLFAGTPEIAVPALRLLAEHHTVVGVLTTPNRPTGRGRLVEASAVGAVAAALGIPILQPERLDREARQLVGELDPEILVCVAYGKIFGPRFLALFPAGGINMHPSLLPRYRGPAPIPAAILAGDDVTGVTVQALAEEMDAGDLFFQTRIPLSGNETSASLTELCASIGARAVLSVVDAIEAGSAERLAQEHQHASYTHIIGKEDGRIDWSRDALHIQRMVRAFYPWPLAFTDFRDQRLNILDAAIVADPEGDAADPVLNRHSPGKIMGVDKTAGILVQTGNGTLSVRKLQLQNRKPLDWKSFVNGVRDLPGSFFGG
ncbi:MAG TPA: methionyl-tRNA formyltransferase [Spirochaetia bacterium]|nr:methionyl-tRNA formyltransferase [Spirochaetia bacterium]